MDQSGQVECVGEDRSQEMGISIKRHSVQITSQVDHVVVYLHICISLFLSTFKISSLIYFISD